MYTHIYTCMVVQTPMDNMLMNTGMPTTSLYHVALRIKTTFSCEVIHAPMASKRG